MAKASPTTKSSTFRLSEVAQQVRPPAGVVTTGWPAVREKCRDLGITFRPWQNPVGQLILAKRETGKYAASIGGTGMSIPRQVGKTFLVGAIVFALCLLRPKLTVIWTAHRTRTAEETFGKMQAFAKRKKIAPFVEKIVLGSGEEEIRFTNGSRILFGARERGFGRGFDEVDVLIFDEAQILTENALDDMIPATNQSRQDTGALLLFMGTPPKPKDPGEVFTRMRTEALAGEDDDTCWVEFGADADYEPTPLPAPLEERDWEQIARANPSFPEDTPREAILRMRKKLGPDSFLREGVGIWDANTSRAVVDPLSWDGVKDPASMAVANLALGISATPDRSTATVSLAGQRADELWHVEVDEQRGGMSWVVRHVADRCAKNDIRAIVMDAADPAVSLVDEFKKAGFKVTITTTREASAACGQFYDSVIDTRDVRHIDQPQLNVALSLARKKKLGIGWVWDPLNSPGDITPTTSMTSALWGARSTNVKRPGRGKQTSSERRAVVM
ncbi:terminase large subunit domain-containing protein [Nocardioides ochotonae]|uniref:terminase large subunit domain-containing protein n=1 Tax=Nocardioides ochotonae TaxID=2685869 RepID=UPI001408A5E6|nr:terminase family protein [Nocardioides ochotonae]